VLGERVSEPVWVDVTVLESDCDALDVGDIVDVVLLVRVRVWLDVGRALAVVVTLGVWVALDVRPGAAC